MKFVPKEYHHFVNATKKISRKELLRQAGQENRGQFPQIFSQWISNKGLWGEYANAGAGKCILQTEHPFDYINRCFIWEATPQGFAFWRNVNDDWHKYLSGILKRGYVPYKFRRTNTGEFFRMLAHYGAEKKFNDSKLKYSSAGNNRWFNLTVSSVEYYWALIDAFPWAANLNDLKFWEDLHYQIIGDRKNGIL